MILDITFPPDSRVENEAVSLIHAGHKVYLFCLNYGGESEQEVINGIHVRRYKTNKWIYKLSALAYTFPFYRWLMAPKIRRFVTQYKPDVLHVHDMVIAETVLRMNKGLHKVVLDFHENRPEIMQYYGHTSTLMGKILISIDRWRRKQIELINRADQLVLVTEEAKKDMLDQGVTKIPEDITVVPNTVHPEIFLRYELNQQIIDRFSGTFNILYLGDTNPRRGTDTAILAIKKLVNIYTDIRLILVGKNSQDFILHKLVDVHGLHQHIVFEGWQDVSLFPSYIMAAQVCISPLKRNRHHDTTYANKIFQYMAMGKPVIVSDCPAQAHVIQKENCGLVHAAEDADELAEMIKEIKENPEKAEKMGANAKNAIQERWNWNKSSIDLINMYR